MTIPFGTKIYSLGTPPVLGTGYLFTIDEFQQILDPVTETFYDTEGSALLREMMQSVADTGFERNAIERIIQHSPSIDNWRIGEALAEVYLTEHRHSLFPWTTSRDVRNINVSLPGADLVGFQRDSDSNESYRFLFGEVKTSQDNSYPPNVMYGRSGMIFQIENICNNIKVRDVLVKYILFRIQNINNSTYKTYYKIAVKRYLHNNKDCILFGVLVRDVEPNIDDLRTRIQHLESINSQMITIELIALYLPIGQISFLGDAVSHIHGGAA
jgi:hypothetical protein